MSPLPGPSAAPGPGLRPAPSLRSRLVRHVMGPLALTWLLGTGVALGVATYFTRQAFDRSLLDDAYSLAFNVRRAADGGLDLVLTAHEIQHLLFDQSEEVFFAVYRQDGSLLAGHAGLRPSVAQDPASGLGFEFSAMTFQGKHLHSVTLQPRDDRPFQVVIAQTTRSRDRLLKRLLLFSLAPQIGLLLLLALWLRRAIQQELTPLTQVQHSLAQRDVHDLSPMTLQHSSRDLQALTQSLNDLFERIAQGVQAQREFSGNVAHELRTPLAGIRALAEYGLSQTSPERWRQQLQRIVASESRASHLVNQLLALALVAEARSGLPLVKLDLCALARDVLLRYLPKADAAGADLGAQGLDQPCWVQANSTLVEGALINLLDNALRYGRPTEAQSAAAPHRITLELRHQPMTATAPACVDLCVLDQGPGMSQSQREQLMQRWAQGEAGLRQALGAGLGLAIVAQYARAMQASLLLLPVSGGGLCACVRFPAR